MIMQCNPLTHLHAFLTGFFLGWFVSTIVCLIVAACYARAFCAPKLQSDAEASQWEEMVDSESRRYYYNKTTGETSWSNPANQSGTR